MALSEWGELGKTSSEGGFADYVGNFAQNTLFWSPLSLLGVKAPDYIQKWEAENPISSLVSGLVGYTAPYIGWAKAAKSLPSLAKLEKTIDKTDYFTRHSIQADIAKEVVRFAPFEAGRIGVAAIAGQGISNSLGTEFEGTANVALNATRDLAFTGVAGGLISGFQHYKGTRGPQLPANINLNKSIQEQYSALMDDVANGVVGDIPQAKIDLKQMEDAIWNQKAKDVAGGTVVGALEGEVPRGAINRLMKERKGKHTDSTMPAVNPGKASPYFRKQELRDEQFELAGIPKDAAGYLQFLRFHYAKATGPLKSNKKGIKNLERDFRRLPMVDAADGWRMARESDTGLYVMGRKYADDRWVSFKTDRPEKFLPEQANFAAEAEKRAKWYQPESLDFTPLSAANELFDHALEIVKNTPVMNKEIFDQRSTVGRSFVQKTMKALGLEATEGTENFTAAANFINEYIRPAVHRYNRNPVAAQTAMIIKQVKDGADAVVQKKFFGEFTEAGGKGKSLGQIGRGRLAAENTTRSIDNMIDDLYKDSAQVEAVWRTINGGHSVEKGIDKFGLNKAGVEVLAELKKLDKWQLDGMAALSERTGKNFYGSTEMLENHYMMSRIWKGAHRVELKVDGKRVGFASGNNSKEAMRQAELYRERFKGEGMDLEVGAPSYVGSDAIANNAHLQNINIEGAQVLARVRDGMYMNKKVPTRLASERQGAVGYVGELTPWTKKEFKDTVLNQLKDYQYLNAKETTDYLTKMHMNQIAAHDSATANSLLDDFNKTYGAQTGLSKDINKFTDRLLAPAFGPQTATRMANAVNKYMYATTLGFVNTGFNMANLATFAQTAFPHMQYITSTLPERMSKMYSYYPMMTENGMKQVASMNVFKITRETFREMKNPDKVLMGNYVKAVDEGMLGSQMLEQAIGKNAEVARHMSTDNVVDWIGKAATAMPHATESWARTQSFTMGHIFWRDVMGVTDPEQLYQLTKKFVANTQYLYGAADRAKIITGPLGSTFGLFKNWMMNYTSWMAEYTGEAFFRGNWKPLAWGVGTTSALGGIAATPFLYSAADKMSQAVSDKSLMENVYQMMGATDEDGLRRRAADSVIFGLPAFLGFSLQNQVTAPGANPLADAARFMDIAVLERGAALGKAIGNSLSVAEATGENPMLQNPQTFGLFMKALAPKALYRTTQSMQDDMLRSSTTGNPVTPLGFFEKWSYNLGLNPVQVDRTYKAHNELWKDQQGMKETVKKLGKAWMEAEAAGDSHTQQGILYRAVAEGVDIDRILKSANARKYKRDTPLIERSFTPEKVLRFAEIGLTSSK